MTELQDSGYDSLLLLIDTLRADHLGCYGYPRSTSPTIDAFSRKSFLFADCQSTCPWTMPSIASLFTGLYPRAIFPPAPLRDSLDRVLPGKTITLAELMKHVGRTTAAFIDHPGVTTLLEYDRGFEHFENFHGEKAFNDLEKYRTPSERIISAMDRFLVPEIHRPFYCYCHVVYPHKPYEAPAPFATMFSDRHQSYSRDDLEKIIGSYDAEIRYTDSMLAGLFCMLQQKGLQEKLVVVITADHGEGFWEHGLFEHGNSLNEENLHVPLIIGAINPSIFPQSLSIRQVSTLDIAPTLCNLSGITFPEPVEGVNLLRKDKTGMSLSTDMAPRFLYAENQHSYTIDGIACRYGTEKLIYNPPFGRDIRGKEAPVIDPILLSHFDLTADPLESGNTFLQHPMGSLRLLVRSLHHEKKQSQYRGTKDSQHRSLDQTTQDQLKELGYIED